MFQRVPTCTNLNSNAGTVKTIKLHGQTESVPTAPTYFNNYRGRAQVKSFPKWLVRLEQIKISLKK